MLIIAWKSRRGLRSFDDSTRGPEFEIGGGILTSERKKKIHGRNGESVFMIADSRTLLGKSLNRVPSNIVKIQEYLRR